MTPLTNLWDLTAQLHTHQPAQVTATPDTGPQPEGDTRSEGALVRQSDPVGAALYFALDIRPASPGMLP